MTAASALVLSLTPTLLPQPVWLQGLVAGLVAAQAYAVGLVIHAAARPAMDVVRRRVGWRPSGRIRRMIDCGPLVVVLLLLVAGTVIGHAGQARLDATFGIPAPPLSQQATAVGLALLICAGLLRAARAAVAGLRRAVRSRRTMAWLLAPVLALGGCAAPGAAYGAGIPPGPAGEPASAASLGPKGRRFVDGGPHAPDIAAVTGRPAREPIRVYVGLASAQTPAARARLAVNELERRDAFDRAVLVVVVPTGSGWVNPAAVAALEYLYRGDVASVVVQYSNKPSFVTYLSRRTAHARTSASALLEAVRARWAELPAARRPRLVIYGESLGALGAISAYAAVGHHTVAPTDGALWVGVPAIGGGRVAAGGLVAPGVRVLIHDEDPVAAWSPDLIWRRTPYWPRHWYPLVTFWQATADMAAAYWTGTGHGHRYAAELVDAWAEVAPPHEVAADRLPAVRAATLSVGTGAES
jgi:uncharacterized membrane protein